MAETPFTAFTSKKRTEQILGRLVVRRIPDLNPRDHAPARTHCSTPGASTPSSPRPTPTSLDTVAADKTHRGHAIIEQVHRRPEELRPRHLPSGKFTANAAWLEQAVIAFNLARAAAVMTGPSWPSPPPRRCAASW